MKLKPLQRLQLAFCLLLCLFSSLIFILSCGINYRQELAKEHVRFRQEMPTMDSWINSPFGKLKSYLFNVTNSEAFLNGTDTKLKLDQIGPIVYNIVGYNDILERTEHNVTYRKHRYRRVEFLPEESVSPDILNQTIILPNSILLGSAAKFSHEAPYSAFGFDAVTLGEDVFVTGSIYYFLWEFTRPGLEMMSKFLTLTSNCGLLHNALKEKEEVYTVNIGPESGIENFFRIKSLNNDVILKEQRQRTRGPDGESCPAYVKGALDNSLFPPFVQKDTPLTLVAIESCRTLPLNYKGEEVYQGIDTFRYTLIRPYEEAPKCLQNTYGVKLPRAMFDASKCVINDAPSCFSQPHFYGSDYNWERHFEGLHPNEEEHEGFVLLEPVTGIPITEKYRFQSNIPVPDLRFYSQRLRMFSNMILPAFWYEFEMGELPDLVTRLMWININVVPHLQWSVMTLALLLALWSGLKVVRLFYGNISYRQLYHRICCDQAGGRNNVLLATTFPQDALTQCQNVNVK